MIVSLHQDADAESVLRELASLGQWVSPLHDDRNSGGRQLIIAAHSTSIPVADVLAIRGVRAVAIEPSAHPRIDAQGPTVDVSGVRIGPRTVTAMCGPCSVESQEQMNAIAARLAPLGVRILRGGAFKPRTSPYAFQGHGEPALQWMRRAADKHGMRIVTEALSDSDVPTVAAYADMLQVGSRNMQNFALLRTIGAVGKPVLLKRGMAATVEEWLLAAEHLLVHGAAGVVFCERGIRGFDPSMRNLLDLGTVALFAHVLRLPIVVDPSHGVGRRDLVLPLARAAIAAGAAGVMIETHDRPGDALSDGPQALPLDALCEALPGLVGAPS